MSLPDAVRTIAVLGHYHGRNLGDELVVETIIAAARARNPGAEVLAISLAPWDTEARHGVRSIPVQPFAARAPQGEAATSDEPRSSLRAFVRRIPGALPARRAVASAARLLHEVPFLFRAYRLLRGVDTVVLAGSGQLFDYLGAWNHPYAIFRWAVLSRWTRTRFVVPSIGAGPLDTRLGRLMVRRVVAAADYVSVRDRYSAELLHSVGVKRDLPVRPDMGYAYRLPDGFRESFDGPTRVGVNPMAHQDPRYGGRGDGRRFQAYLQKMIEFVAQLLDDGHHVVLFSSQTSNDPLVVDDILEALESRGLARDPRLVNALAEIEGSDDLVRTIEQCDYVVAGRYHAILLALALGIPTIGFAYHPKTADLLVRVGHPDWCLDIDAFTPEALHVAFEDLRASDSAEVRERLRSSAAELRAVVEAQFDEILR